MNGAHALALLEAGAVEVLPVGEGAERESSPMAPEVRTHV